MRASSHYVYDPTTSCLSKIFTNKLSQFVKLILGLSASFFVFFKQMNKDISNPHNDNLTFHSHGYEITFISSKCFLTGKSLIIPWGIDIHCYFKCFIFRTTEIIRTGWLFARFQTTMASDRDCKHSSWNSTFKLAF